MMILKKIISLVVLTLLPSVLQPQALHVELIEELVIGDDEDASEEYLFANPQHICTDSQNNIYIADKNMSKIRVFNRNGKFLKYIGRKGQGPGEMQEVISMTIDHNDNLIVVDRMNQRFTKFTNLGDDFEIYQIPGQSFIDPFWIYPLGKNAYAIYYPPIANGKSKAQRNHKMIHIYSLDLSSIQESLALAGEIWDFRKPFQRAQSRSNSLNINIIDDNKIVIVPKLYRGTLYLYKNKKNSWHQTTVTGTIPENEPYEELLFSEQNINLMREKAKKSGIEAIASSGREGRFLVLVKNWSAGLFQFNSEHFVHFFHIWQNKRKYVFGVDVFTKDGKLLGYASLNLPGSKRNSAFAVQVLWKDKENRYYIKDTREIPIILIVRLNFDFINN